MPAMANLAVSVTARTASFEQGLKRTESAARQWHGRMKGLSGVAGKAGIIGGLVGAGVTVGLQAFAAVTSKIRDALASAMEFRQELHRAAAIFGDAGTALRERLGGAALEVANRFSFAGTEVVKALRAWATEGWSAVDAMQAMPIAAEFAKANILELGNAVELLSEAITAFRSRSNDAFLNMGNLSRASDILTKASQMGGGSVADLGEALKTAGDRASFYGKSIEEVTAALLVLDDAGLKAGMAGELLAKLWATLAVKSADADSKLNGLGISALNARGQLRSTADIVTQLQTALDGLGVAQQAAILAEVGFGERYVKGIIALMRNADALRINEAALRDVGNVTAEVAAQAESAWSRLGAGIKTSALQAAQYGIALTEPIVRFINMEREGFAKLGEAVGATFSRVDMATEQWMNETIEALGKAAAVKLAQRRDEELAAEAAGDREAQRSYKIKENEAKRAAERSAAFEGFQADLASLEQRIEGIGDPFADLTRRARELADVDIEWGDMFGASLERLRSSIALESKRGDLSRITERLRLQGESLRLTERERDLREALDSGATAAELAAIERYWFDIYHEQELQDAMEETNREIERRAQLMSRGGGAVEYSPSRTASQTSRWTYQGKQIVNDPQLQQVITLLLENNRLTQQSPVGVAG